MRKRNNITVSFDDEVPLLQAVRILRDSKEIITDVLSPFPVHGLDEALSLKRSRIYLRSSRGNSRFWFSGLGLYGKLSIDNWRKAFLFVPTFIPITFEVTVLFAGLSMVAALLVRSKLKPDIRFKPVDERITDDRFVILINAEDEEKTLTRVKSLLSGINTLEIR